MAVLNLNDHDIDGSVDISFGNEKQVEESAFCVIKWYGREKRYGFVFRINKEDVQHIPRVCKIHKSTLVTAHFDNLYGEMEHFEQNKFRNNKNKEGASDAQTSNVQENPDFNNRQDIFIHGSKLDPFATNCFLNPGDVVNCRIVSNNCGFQVDRINKYYIVPREQNMKMCRGRIKSFNQKKRYGFVKADDSEQIPRDIFVLARKVTNYSLTVDDLQDNVPVICYFTIEDDKYIAQKLEIINTGE